MMGNSYHELANVVDLQDANDLTISRARKLYDAIQCARDYTLVRILRRVIDGNPAFECFDVEVECDGVPSRNLAGIQYRERLALCVPADSKKMVEVLALRKDFPIMMHQNQVPLGTPASLCLYSEPPVAVTRAWTPQRFLRRIQWWLEKSSRGELHPSDQQVEQLFFTSNYELVLPWNFDELRQDPSQQFMVTLWQKRPDEGFTRFMLPIDPNCAKDKTVKHVELVLPSIVHGQIERDPTTLGQLSDLLMQRKVNLIDPLCEVLQAGINDKGSAASDNNDIGTVILLRTPIKRKEDAKPEGFNHRAFLILVPVLELGVACGALFQLEKKYYNANSLNALSKLNGSPNTAWRDLCTMPMEVLMQNDDAAARRQSGIAEEGPTGVLVGAGSLGSALLNLWSRSGWGRWSVIDNDYIKPHNLSRHTARFRHIGQTKATVVAELHDEIMCGATSVTPIEADACNFEQESVSQAIHDAGLVVDASTVLQYPRAVSIIDALPRHFSVFVTPDGNGAVLLAEDTKRSHRLRTLEAQYYRALIDKDFGKTHLPGHVGTFWSGMSCRDISFVMPYSRILGHASTLAEQIQSAATKEDALIRIWQRDPVLGTVEVHDMPVMAEQRFELNGFELYIDEGVLLQLRHLRQQSLPNETGGVVLGYYDFNINTVVVVTGLPAPLDSKSAPIFFERGFKELDQVLEDVSKRTADQVCYIGEWHSHPPGSSTSPSRNDLIQLADLSQTMADDGLPAVQIIVGEQDVRVLQGVVKTSLTKWSFL